MKLSKQSFVLALALVFSMPGFAANPLIPAPPKVAASAYLLLDADSGEVLVEENSAMRVPPASLTKMMTSYIAAGELAQGNISMEDKVRVSVKAWKTPGSRMFIQEGNFVTFSDLIRGVVIQSGNDASVAVAEHVAGSEDAFADLMNKHAQALGMSDSSFMNATGLPAENHFTSAADLAKLAKAIITKYPEHHAIYAEKYFTYNKIRQPNRNKLLWRDPSVDGLKTGHTEEAGYCLVSSAQRNGMRLIAVVMGTNSEEARANESQKLLTYGFRYYETHKLYEAGAILNEARLWGGAQDAIQLGITQDLYVTIPRGQHADLEANLDIDSFIEAPVEQHAQRGKVNIALEGKTILERPLVALEAAEEGSFFKRIWDQILMFFYQLIA